MDLGWNLESGSDFTPLLVYDVDGDGKAEVITKTAEGTKAVSLERIQDVTFKQAHRSTVKQEEFRNLLTLKLDWAGGKPGRTADVGLFYVQRGIRWIPRREDPTN